MRTSTGASRSAWIAAGAYFLITIALTWPLARGIARDVAWDLGDSLLNMWILAWDAEQLKAILRGDFARVRTFFDANIFHPEPRTLAYSEHLFAQAVQAFPIYLATRNPILCYNLLFLSTFVLCGLGTFLLVRDLTRNTPAAFLAGLLFAFAPYRFAQVSHLQVLSVQWMPFVLYGFRRYFDGGRPRALAGAAAALVAQNLSCGYYLLYFAPLAGMYVAWEIATRGRWRDRRMWRHLATAAVAVAIAMAPFLLPYKRVRDTLQLSRDVVEISRYSADVYSYFTAFEHNRAWGSIVREYPKPEGELFPGMVPLILGLASIAAWIVQSFRLKAEATGDIVASGFSRKAIVRSLFVVAAAHVAMATIVLFRRRVDIELAFLSIRATDITRLLVIAAACAIVALLLSPRARARVVGALHQPEAIFITILVAAWWLSLGPSPRVYGRVLEIWAPYKTLFDYVPGYDAVRAPARFAMIVALALAILAGVVVARVRRASMAAGVLGLAFLLESHSLPFLVNVMVPLRHFATPEARVYRPRAAPPIYHAVARVRSDAVLLEIPFNEPDYDVRAVYYSTAHWRKLVNGYSGFFPLRYSRLAAILRAFDRADDIAWRALAEVGVTHVIVHEGAYLDDEGLRFSAWLRARGAVEVSRDRADVLFELPAPPP